MFNHVFTSVRFRVAPFAIALALAGPSFISTPTVQADDPPTIQQLSSQMRKAYRAADYKKALEAAEKMHELIPDDPRPMYNIACMNALLGEKEKAYTWLDRAVDSGYCDDDQLLADADFRTLWGESRYRNIIKRIREGKKGNSESATEKASPRKEQPPVAEANGKPKPKPKSDEPIEALPKIPDMSAREHAEKANELTQKLLQVSSPEKRDEALRISLEALAHALACEKAVGAQATPLVALTHYNAACMYSLKKDVERAFRHLDRAVDIRGWNPSQLLNQMSDDSDLDNLRKDDRYAALIKRIKEQPAASQPEGRRRPSPIPNPNRDEGDKSTVKNETEPMGPALSNHPDPSTMTADQIAARIEELTPALMKAAQAGDYRNALEYAVEANDLADNALTNYNVACMYSLNKEAEAAFHHLFRSFELGGLRGNPIDQLKNDADLNNLHDDPRWNDVLAKARQQLEAKGALPKDHEVEFKYGVTLPPKYDASKSAPLIVALHHYHGNMDTTTDRWKAAAAAVGAILLTPQGALESGDGSGAFQWGDDFPRIEKNIMRAINEVMDKHKIDDRRVVIAGFSQGADVAYRMAVRNPDAFTGLVPIAGMFNPDSMSVFDNPELKNLHVYIIVGSEDNSQIIKANALTFENLKKAGATTFFNRLDGVGHEFPKNAVKLQLTALKFAMGD